MKVFHAFYLNISIIMQNNKGFSCYFTSQGPPWDTPKSTPGALDDKQLSIFCFDSLPRGLKYQLLCSKMQLFQAFDLTMSIIMQ